MEVDQEMGFSPNRHDHFKHVSYTKSCGSKMTHKNFCEVLFHELIIHSHEENVTASGISTGRSSLFLQEFSLMG
jgi:hypothetical protein